MANAKICVGDPTQPIFHWLALEFCIGGNANCTFRIGGNANFSVFRYQHVGIPNAKFRVGGLRQCKDPTFASQWNIGFTSLLGRAYKNICIQFGKSRIIHTDIGYINYLLLCVASMTPYMLRNQRLTWICCLRADTCEMN